MAVVWTYVPGSGGFRPSCPTARYSVRWTKFQCRGLGPHRTAQATTQ